MQEENQQEEELFDQVSTCLGSFLKKFNDAALPYVETIMPLIAPLLDKSRSDEERRIGVCVVDDLLDHSPAGRAKYSAQVVPILLDACTSNDPDLRQCSVYGLGVLASKAPEIFNPIAAEVLKRILAIIQHPEARGKGCNTPPPSYLTPLSVPSDDTNEMATDNAISVLSKFVLQPYCDVFPDAFSTWLGSLPLTADRVEAIANHDLLVRLVEQRDPRVIGQAHHLVKV